jgi:outer membrane protein OmpA-like peptidoglycan-associated protein
MNRTLQIIKITLIILLLMNGSVMAQIYDNVKSYAIIGAFSLEKNAQKFADYYKSQSLSSKIKMNEFNRMYYVYAFESPDIEAARSKVLSIRGQYKALSKSWLYNGNFNCLHIPSDQLSSAKENLAHEAEALKIQKDKEMAEAKPKPVVIQEPKVVKPDDIFWLYFNAYNVTNLSEVEGNITVYDAERNKEIAKEKSHQLISLKEPRNGTNRVKFTSDVFGYRIISRSLDLDEPITADTESFVSMEGDSIIIDFPLVRYNKGDFMTMWNVYFFIDAAIMKEESVIELNQLLAMMKENEATRIMIHGHTNGNSNGIVKHLDLDDKSFFSLNGSHLEDKASAKKLSLYRAHTIKYWLVDQGINENRMDVIGWGGKKMLYDKMSTNADKNVRVEIEILE